MRSTSSGGSNGGSGDRGLGQLALEGRILALEEAKREADRARDHLFVVDGAAGALANGHRASREDDLKFRREVRTALGKLHAQVTRAQAVPMALMTGFLGAGLESGEPSEKTFAAMGVALFLGLFFPEAIEAFRKKARAAAAADESLPPPPGTH